jgi:hypothetical protein
VHFAEQRAAPYSQRNPRTKRCVPNHHGIMAFSNQHWQQH